MFFLLGKQFIAQFQRQSAVVPSMNWRTSHRWQKLYSFKAILHIQTSLVKGYFQTLLIAIL